MHLVKSFSFCEITTTTTTTVLRPLDWVWDYPSEPVVLER